MPCREYLLELSLRVRLPVLSAFELHPFLCQSYLLYAIGFTLVELQIMKVFEKKRRSLFSQIPWIADLGYVR